MPWSTILAITLGLGLIGTAVAFIRETRNPLHDPSDDDAELDDLHVASVARRGRGFVSFHTTELDQ